MSDKTIKRGEIYWVNFSDSKRYSKKKIRPVVILQNDTGNKYSPNTIVATCTAAPPQAYLPVMVQIPKNICGLTKTTWVDLSSIMTLEKSEILDKTGEITATIMKEIDNAVKISLGLNDLSSDPFF